MALCPGWFQRGVLGRLCLSHVRSQTNKRVPMARKGHGNALVVISAASPLGRGRKRETGGVKLSLRGAERKLFGSLFQRELSNRVPRPRPRACHCEPVRRLVWQSPGQRSRPRSAPRKKPRILCKTTKNHPKQAELPFSSQRIIVYHPLCNKPHAADSADMPGSNRSLPHFQKPNPGALVIITLTRCQVWCMMRTVITNPSTAILPIRN